MRTCDPSATESLLQSSQSERAERTLGPVAVGRGIPLTNRDRLRRMPAVKEGTARQHAGKPGYASGSSQVNIGRLYRLGTNLKRQTLPPLAMHY